ncbi:MAG TPA: beta-ketoacyl-ACP synthase III [Aggregatilineaceae bacterium]|nr:beta-ketoacyl-ACP synthase III [Aggregatilineaceae bacterium]
MSERYAKITGWGKYVPERILTNDELSKMVETSDEWITTRTGIRERRIRTEKDTTSSMSVAAAQEALKVAGITPSDLDLIIVATSSPDYLLPSVASQVQHLLGADCGAFTLVAGCSGWVYALTTASQFIMSGGYNRILVVGVEIISFALDFTDRTTCVLFGDAAAASVVEASDEPGGVLSYELGSDGAGALALYVPDGGSTNPVSQKTVDERRNYIQMDGQEVFKFAVRTLASSLKRTIYKAGLTPDDIDLFIPHQANARIIEAAARQMRVPVEKFYMNLDRYGNTSAASVPLALVEAIEEGRLKDGDKVAMCAFGAGLTWASAVVQMGIGEISAAHSLFSVGRARYLARRTSDAVLDTAQGALLPLYAILYQRQKRKKK